MEEEEEQQHEADEEEDELVFKRVMDESVRTHAEHEARMCQGLDIVLHRSVEEAQHPPPLPPPWYETMELDLPPAPPLLEGLIGQN